MKKIFLNVLIFVSIYASAQVTPVVDSVVMRDGEKLAVDIYIPDTTGGKTYPTILIQTPYNRLFYRLSLPLNLGQSYANGKYVVVIADWRCFYGKYVVVIADWRCFYGSAGACVLQPDRGKDGYDIVEWIATKPWSSGKVGTWGPSALGKIQYQTAKENPPHLTCCAPLVAGPQFNYEEYYPGGVFRTEYVEQLDALGYGLSAFLKNNQVYNPTWQYIEQLNNYPNQINVPLFMVGGWFDHNTDLMIDFFNDVRALSPISVRNKHKLLMGPWVHGGHGASSVGSETQGELAFPEAAGWSDSLALRFFDYYLRNENNGWEQELAIKYFKLGDNTWESVSDFPPAIGWTPDCVLSNCDYLQIPIPVKSANADSTYYFCEFQYDPRNPSPTIGGTTLRSDLLQGPYDQSSIESRADLIPFSSMNIFDCNDHWFSILGKSKVHLLVSSDRKDTDFTVRLTDVYPDGRSIIIGEGIKRMRFRNGYSAADTSSIDPGEVYPIEIDLPFIAYSFLPNHKIRLDVSSSNYPRYDCNLNNGGAMYVAGDTLVATNRVYNYHSATGLNSYVYLPFVDFCPGSINELENSNYKAYFSEGNLILASNKSIKDFEIEVCDSKNSSVFSVKKQSIFNGEAKKYNLSNLSNGIYILKIIDNTNIVKCLKLIKF